MSRTSTNERKRKAMKALVAGLLERGWTITRLAAYTGYTSSGVSAWKAGRSMGTNAQREVLAKLPDADHPDVLEKLKEGWGESHWRVQLRQETVDEMQTEAYLREKARSVVQQLEQHMAMSGRRLVDLRSGRRQPGKWVNEESVQAEIAEIKAKMADEAGILETAKVEAAKSLKWERKQLRGEEKLLREATRALASYGVKV